MMVVDLLGSADVSREAIRRGDTLTPAAVRLAAREGRLPVAAVTPGGQRLFDRAVVEQWLDERAARRWAAR